MEQRRLGSTGVSVSKLCLGAMMFGDWDQGPRREHPDHPPGAGCRDHLRRHRRRLLPRRVRGDRGPGPGGRAPRRRGPGDQGAQPDGLRSQPPRQLTPLDMREVEDSLRRLGTDWIDLYQIHRRDPDTDIDETLGALTDLARAGKVRYVGHSTFPASAIVERSGPHRTSAGNGSGPSSRPTRSSPAGLRPRYCPPASGTGWA